MKRFQPELTGIERKPRCTSRLAFLGTTIVAIAAIGGCAAPPYPRKLMSELEAEATSQQLSKVGGADSGALLVTHAGPPATLDPVAISLSSPIEQTVDTQGALEIPSLEATLFDADYLNSVAVGADGPDEEIAAKVTPDSIASESAVEPVSIAGSNLQIATAEFSIADLPAASVEPDVVEARVFDADYLDSVAVGADGPDEEIAAKVTPDSIASESAVEPVSIAGSNLQIATAEFSIADLPASSVEPEVVAAPEPSPAVFVGAPTSIVAAEMTSELEPSPTFVAPAPMIDAVIEANPEPSQTTGLPVSPGESETLAEFEPAPSSGETDLRAESGGSGEIATSQLAALPANDITERRAKSPTAVKTYNAVALEPEATVSDGSTSDAETMEVSGSPKQSGDAAHGVRADEPMDQSADQEVAAEPENIAIPELSPTIIADAHISPSDAEAVPEIEPVRSTNDVISLPAVPVVEVTEDASIPEMASSKVAAIVTNAGEMEEMVEDEVASVFSPRAETPPAGVIRAVPPPPQLASTSADFAGEIEPTNELFELEIMFGSGSDDLSEQARADLTRLTREVDPASAATLHLSSFAVGAQASPSDARRLSLARLFKIRDFLIEQGFRNEQMKLLPLPSGEGTEPENRVDLQISKI